MSTWMMARTEFGAVNVAAGGPGPTEGSRAAYSCGRRANARAPASARPRWSRRSASLHGDFRLPKPCRRTNLCLPQRPNAYGLREVRLRMNAINHAMAVVLTVTAALSAGCAERRVKEMVSTPEARQAEGTVTERRALVLFRVAMELDGQAVDAPFSAFHSMSLLTSVGAVGAPLTPGHGFLPGGLDLESHRSGWAFLALPPGRYQLAFEGLGARFDTPGARFTVVAGAPIGLSPPYTIVVPPDGRLIYVGTFGLTCHTLGGKRGAPDAACAMLGVRDESVPAGQIVRTRLSRYAPMLVVLASASDATRIAYP